MRVNELANELGKTSKQILELIKQSDPSSSMYAVSKVTPEQESAVRRALTPRKEAAPVHQEKAAPPVQEAKAAPAAKAPEGAEKPAGQPAKKKLTAVFRPQNAQQQIKRPAPKAPARPQQAAPAPARPQAAEPAPKAETVKPETPAVQAQSVQPQQAAPAPAPAHAAPGSFEPEPEIPIQSIPDPTAPVSPEDTAEIDLQAVEAKLNDPGSTMDFEPITDDLIDTDATFDAGTSSMLMWGARSDVGCVRSHNEDSYLAASPLFCVCDGMGGHAAGEVASAIAVETIAKTGPKSADAAQLAASIEAANAAIIEAAVNGVGRPGMGCTATAAYIEGTTLAIAHVGDSRAYLLHEGTLIRVTRDHSYVEELVDAGEITADEARTHPNRSVITRALGSDPAMYADHFTLNVEEGDRLILCSDGMSGMVPDGEIERIAQQSSTAQICTDNLVDAALAAGGGDNVTVVVVDITDDGRVREVARKHKRTLFFAIVGLLIALIVAGVASFISIRKSVYLGVKDDAVAIYTGIPDSLLGLKLNWLEDETSIQLKYLPEDTQNRLREGIPQKNLKDAQDAVENYRAQIDETQTKLIEDARAIQQDRTGSTEAPGTSPADALAGGTSPSESPADAISPSTTTEGGAA